MRISIFSSKAISGYSNYMNEETSKQVYRNQQLKRT